ncbi:hypothetical protein HNR46_003378 [Haloferula luteola]|uniref:Uncharacterized protein n=1 Tax=Haloferula luteola TaxID=595692 RepID=A0A840V529_9BACT|nr:hypothetical protein [Haloferula luteola]MBB5353125.1 hypothetical protein [Haloferula luteola]
MNRLTRIALTLFVSATILAFLAKARLERVQDLDPLKAAERIEQETQMGWLAVGISATMALGGIGLLGYQWRKGRPSAAS